MFNPLLNNKLKEDSDSVFIFSSNPSTSNQNENIEPPSLVKKRNLNRSKTPPSIDKAKDNNEETSAREILSKSSVKGLRNKSKNLSTTKNSSSKEKETTEQQKKPPKNLNKKNVRGETPLHVAAIKGNKKRVEELLSFGAEVNTKDHNGWTPLHEACSHGFCDIVEMLLDHGAILDCVGGEENDTPLHDAVSNRRVEVVQCLLARGAQTNIRNAQGYTAEEMALTSELKTIFKEATFMNIGKANESINNVETSFVTTDAPTSDEEKIFVSSNLNNQELKIFKTSCEKMNIKIIKDFDQSATHLICGADEVNIARTRTLKYMFSLLTGKWIVNLQWLTESAKQGVWLNETDYEIIGTQDCNGDIPKKARLNRLKAFPKLFEGCSFYLRGSFSKLLSKDILRNLIKTGGGKILLREPKTDISDPLLTPISPAVNKLIKNKQGASRIFHAQENSAQVCCAEYIIYDPSLSKAKDIVSSPLLCTAPTTWLLNCVSSFSIIEINDLDMIENIQTSQ